MSATGLLLFLLGVWIILNAPNLAGVIQGKIDLGAMKPTSSSSESTSSTTTADGRPIGKTDSGHSVGSWW